MFSFELAHILERLQKRLVLEYQRAQLRVVLKDVEYFEELAIVPCRHGENVQYLVFFLRRQDTITAHFLLSAHTLAFFHPVILHLIAIFIILIIIHHQVLLGHLLHVMHAWS